VAEVAQQPPEAFGPAHVPVGDDEDAVADARPACSACKRFELGKRMSPGRSWRRGEVGVDIEETCPRDVSLEVELAAAARITELPAAVDELVAQSAETLRGFGLSGGSWKSRDPCRRPTREGLSDCGQENPDVA
jgi:hypothetical protein